MPILNNPEMPILNKPMFQIQIVADKLSETVNIIANEPSLAFFRIQEHVRKTLPQLVDQKVRFSLCFLSCLTQFRV